MSGIECIVKACDYHIVRDRIPTAIKLINDSKSHSIIRTDYCVRKLVLKVEKGFNSTFAVNRTEFAEINSSDVDRKAMLCHNSNKCVVSVFGFRICKRTGNIIHLFGTVLLDNMVYYRLHCS